MVALSAATTPVAFAQMQPGAGGMPPPGGMGNPGGEEETKPEGPAEAAPPDAVIPVGLPKPPDLGPSEDRTKKTLPFNELHGYLRFRTALNHKLGLGMPDNFAYRSCNPLTQICDQSVGTANMRLRLEPVFNVVSEQVVIKAQIDLLDNNVLGSNPEGYAGNTARPGGAPLSAFSTTQEPPTAGQNSPWDSIRVKRAWAEVRTPVGLLMFGRMPSDWGLGLLANGGGYSRFTDSYCYDCDEGTTADRAMFITEIPGTSSGKPEDPRLRVAIGVDWAGTGLTTGISSDYRNRYIGQPSDVTDDDDLNEWVFVVGKFHQPAQWKTKVDRGQLAWDYGLYGVYRSQSKDIDLKATPVGADPALANLVARDASAFIMDGFSRLRYRHWSAEAELVGIFGSIGSSKELSPSNPKLDVRQWGGVVRGQYRALDDDLRLGLELGTASGDQAEASGGIQNYNYALPIQPAGDTTVSNFHFNPDYIVDLILFRQILGTVTNATYVKPTLDYDLTNTIVFKSAGIMSFANVPVSTPGNARMYGFELDGSLQYKNVDKAGRGFYAMIDYGVFFPFSFLDDNSALSHPDVPTARPPARLWLNPHSADTAQTLQTRLLVVY